MLTSRELASLIWLGVLGVGLIVVAVRDRKLSKSLLDLLRLAVRPPISVIILTFYLYVAVCALAMQWVGAWNPDLLRETILWCLVSGVALLFSASKADENLAHLRRAIRRTFEATLLIEFIFGLVSFPLAVELIVQPVLAVLILGEMVAKSDERYAPAASCFGTLLAIAGFGFLLGTLVLIWAERGSIEWGDQLLTLGMLIWLPLFSLPFVYLLSWGMQYGALVRLTKWQLDKWQGEGRQVSLKVRFAIIVGFNVDLHALGRARLPVVRDLARSNDSFGDALAVVRTFRQSVTSEQVALSDGPNEPLA